MAWKFILAFALALTAQASIVDVAKADTVIRCDECYDPGPGWFAEQGPLGWTYVVDYTNLGLSLWHVTQAPRFGAITATQYEVDDATYLRFMAIMEAKAEQQMQGLGPVVVHISPGAYNGMLFARDPFGGFSGSNAYEVIQSQNVRNGLGVNLATAMASTGTANVALNNLGVTLNSFLFSVGAPSGFKIIITWSDGSRTTMLIDSSSAHQAQLVAGESKTPGGLPIPDSSAQSPDAGEIYAGEYNFMGDTQGLQAWLQALQMAGVPITGPQSDQLVCTWDGQELSCHYQ